MKENNWKELSVKGDADEGAERGPNLREYVWDWHFQPEPWYNSQSYFALK